MEEQEETLQRLTRTKADILHLHIDRT